MKAFPLDKVKLEEIIARYPTPFHLYDEGMIRENARRLLKAFSWVDCFSNYYAVKACPNPVILNILKEEGFGVDCSSLPELIIASKVGFEGSKVVFTSNDTPAEEFAMAYKMGALINLDDIKHVELLENSAGIPELISFRYNPGDVRTGNLLIGIPQEAKYGVTRDQIIEAYLLMKNKGVKRFGLHTMIASNELDNNYFIETARMMFDLAVRINQEAGINIEIINLGGGMGIPYKPDDKALDLELISAEIKKLYDEIIRKKGLHPVRLVFECGRLITGPAGWLVSKVRHVTEKYKNYVGLDASMADLMRPAIYGAYHHISVVGKESRPNTEIYDVTGSLCENNDKFAIDRHLPYVDTGDLMVIHDTGAHGYSMGFNYNGKLRSAELLLRDDGSIKMIRRAETIEDYLSTLSDLS